MASEKTNFGTPGLDHDIKDSGAKGGELISSAAEPDSALEADMAYKPKSGRIADSLITIVAAPSEEASLSGGQQIELEASNAIKYRTCSWQKVETLHSSCLRPG